MEPKEKTPGSGRLKVLLGVLVSFGCLYFSLREIIHDPVQRQQFIQAVLDANYIYLLPMTGVLFLFFWLKAICWRWLLSSVGTYRTWNDLFPPMLIGIAWNNLLPAQLGEFLRMKVFSRRTGLPQSTVLSSIVAERVFDVIAIICLFTLGQMWHTSETTIKDAGLSHAQSRFDGTTNKVASSAQSKSIIVGMTAGFLLAASLVFVFWTEQVLKLTGWSLRICSIPAHLSDRIFYLLTTAAQGLFALRNPRMLLVCLRFRLLNGCWGVR